MYRKHFLFELHFRTFLTRFSSLCQLTDFTRFVVNWTSYISSVKAKLKLFAEYASDSRLIMSFNYDHIVYFAILWLFFSLSMSKRIHPLLQAQLIVKRTDNLVAFISVTANRFSFYFQDLSVRLNIWQISLWNWCGILMESFFILPCWNLFSKRWSFSAERTYYFDSFDGIFSYSFLFS